MNHKTFAFIELAASWSIAIGTVKSTPSQELERAYFKLESERAISDVGFQALQLRLLAEVNARIDNGFFTERGLARMTGISQPHLHHILKGARKLSPKTADILLAHLGIPILCLFRSDELALTGRKPAGSAVNSSLVPDRFSAGRSATNHRAS